MNPPEVEQTEMQSEQSRVAPAPPSREGRPELTKTPPPPPSREGRPELTQTPPPPPSREGRPQLSQDPPTPPSTKGRPNLSGTEFLGEAHTASSIVYFKDQEKGSKELPEGWKRCELPGKTEQEREALRKDMEKADCEFLESPNGQRFVSFRGTEMGKGLSEALKDWKNNIQQGIGLPTEKYLAAARIGEAFKDMPEVAFTGHSLGGGLAKLAAEKASTPGEDGQPRDSKVCVAFNAAPVNPVTYKREGLATQEHLRTTIHVVNENDVLNRTLKGGKTTFLGGEMITERDKPENSMIVLAQGAGSVVGASGHGNKNLVWTDARGEKVEFYNLKDAQGKTVFQQDYDRFVPSKLMQDRELAKQALETVDRAQSPQHQQHHTQGVGR